MSVLAVEEQKKHSDKKAKKHKKEKKEKKSRKDDEEKQLLKAAKKFLKTSTLLLSSVPSRTSKRCRGGRLYEFESHVILGAFPVHGLKRRSAGQETILLQVLAALQLCRFDKEMRVR